MSQNSNFRAKTTFHRPMRRRSWRTWNRCFCNCYDGSMSASWRTVECRNKPLFWDSLI